MEVSRRRIREGEGGAACGSDSCGDNGQSVCSGNTERGSRRHGGSTGDDGGAVGDDGGGVARVERLVAQVGRLARRVPAREAAVWRPRRRSTLQQVARLRSSTR